MKLRIKPQDAGIVGKTESVHTLPTSEESDKEERSENAPSQDTVMQGQGDNPVCEQVVSVYLGSEPHLEAVVQLILSDGTALQVEGPYDTGSQISFVDETLNPHLRVVMLFVWRAVD